MANRRMWLVHKPTGKRSLLAKHWTNGWQVFTGRRDNYTMQGLFDDTEPNNEDFEIKYEE